MKIHGIRELKVNCRLGFECAAVILGLSMITGSATAGEILQDTAGSINQIQIHSPIGQSFTAEDPFVSFAFFYKTFNFQYGNAPMQMDLYSGIAVAGVPLASVPFLIPDPGQNFDGFFDVDLSSVELVVGNVYTASVTVPSPYWGAYVQLTGNPYAGGVAIRLGAQVPDADWRFRVTPIGAAVDVPEPNTIAIFGLGLAGLVYLRRRRSV